MSHEPPLKTALAIELLERAATVLRLLAHPQRLRIVEYLDAHHAAPVHDLVEHLGLTQAATSQHLNLMKRAGVVRAIRRGREVWYDIADPRSVTILHCIRKQQEKQP